MLRGLNWYKKLLNKESFQKHSLYLQQDFLELTKTGGGGVMRSRKSSTRKKTGVQGSLRSPYKMERLLRWLCSTQARGHLFCFSPPTYFSTLLYLAHALKAPKGDLHKNGKPSPFSLLCIPLCVGKPQQKQFEVNLSCYRHFARSKYLSVSLITLRIVKPVSSDQLPFPKSDR